jgi:hypothetical protein
LIFGVSVRFRYLIRKKTTAITAVLVVRKDMVVVREIREVSCRKKEKQPDLR